jgi:hypothetical protein
MFKSFTKKRVDTNKYLPMTVIDKAIIIVINVIAANFVHIRPQQRP